MKGSSDEIQRIRLLQGEGRWAEALRQLEALRKVLPRAATVYFELGRTLSALKRPNESAAAFRKGLRIDPRMAEAHFNLGNVLHGLVRLNHAARSYERAVEIDPAHAQAWYQLGMIRQMQDLYAEAETAYRRTLAINPNQAPAQNNLGLVLQGQKRTGEAIVAFERAIALNPKYGIALVNLGAVLQHHNRLEEAIAVLQRAVALDAKDSRAHGNLGNALNAMNRTVEAMEAYENARRSDPSFQGNVYNFALAKLVLGDFVPGWAGYESRLDTLDHKRKYPVTQPRWQPGEPLRNRTLFIYSEQGLGDTLQFCRYVPLVLGLGAKVVFQVQHPLKTLLAASLPEVTVIGDREEVPRHDAQCSLLSLPRHFDTRLESIPSRSPYVTAPAAKLAQWKAVFARAPGAKVGLVWAGNPKHQFDHNRSIPLVEFSRLTAEPRAHFFSLQKDVRESDRAAMADWKGVTDLSKNLKSFEDTAAIVAAIDLVITVDTSIAHLAGALGKPAWVLLSFSPDWRWLLNREDSPWYPSLRLLRQDKVGEWPPVIERVRAALAGGSSSS